MRKIIFFIFLFALTFSSKAKTNIYFNNPNKISDCSAQISKIFKDIVADQKAGYQCEIIISMYSTTKSQYATEINQAMQQGAQLKYFVADQHQWNQSYSRYFKRAKNFNVHVCGSANRVIHDKIVAVQCKHQQSQTNPDKVNIFIGSANMSVKSITENYEACIISDNVNHYTSIQTHVSDIINPVPPNPSICSIQ